MHRTSWKLPGCWARPFTGAFLRWPCPWPGLPLRRVWHWRSWKLWLTLVSPVILVFKPSRRVCTRLGSSWTTALQLRNWPPFYWSWFLFCCSLKSKPKHACDLHQATPILQILAKHSPPNSANFLGSLLPLGVACWFFWVLFCPSCSCSNPCSCQTPSFHGNGFWNGLTTACA